MLVTPFPDTENIMRNTLSTLKKIVAGGRKLSMLTCYDAGFAQVMDAAGVDSLLVGDSLGMVVQGHDSTLPVTVDDIAYHVGCLVRSTRRPWLIADMPFGSYNEGPVQALRTAVQLMRAGAQMVKLEGGKELADTVRLLVQSGIPVCGHVGLLPQQVHAMGGFRVQGKEEADAQRIVADARALEAAGAAMVVIEGVPEPVARRVCEETSSIITIGIGASAACDGQVLVMHDMLGLTQSPARFVKDFTQGLSATPGAGLIEQAFRRYVQEVGDGGFPQSAHVYGASSNESAAYGGNPATGAAPSDAARK